MASTRKKEYYPQTCRLCGTNLISKTAANCPACGSADLLQRFCLVCGRDGTDPDAPCPDCGSLRQIWRCPECHEAFVAQRIADRGDKNAARCPSCGIPVLTSRRDWLQRVFGEVSALPPVKRLPAMESLASSWPHVKKIQVSVARAKADKEAWDAAVVRCLRNIKDAVAGGRFAVARDLLKNASPPSGPLDRDMASGLDRTIKKAVETRIRALLSTVESFCEAKDFKKASMLADDAEMAGLEADRLRNIISKYVRKHAADKAETAFRAFVEQEDFDKARLMVPKLVALDGSRFSEKALERLIAEGREKESIRRTCLIRKGLSNADPDFPMLEKECEQLGKRGFADKFRLFRAELDKARSDWTLKRLLPVSDLIVTQMAFGVSRVKVSWTPERSGFATGYAVERIPVSGGETGKWTVPTGNSFLIDDAASLGVPFEYRVTPLFNGRFASGITMSSKAIVCVAPVSRFAAVGLGTPNCGCVDLSWINPPWGASAKVSAKLVRDDDVSWDVSGKTSFEDSEVRCGEIRRYQLSVSVAGVVLDPVECRAVVESVPEPPPVEGARVFLQGGRYRLNIPEWPKGIDSVLLSKPEQKPIPLTLVDYREKTLFFRSEAEALASTIQAIRRIGSKGVVLGPKRSIGRTEFERGLFVSFGKNTPNSLNKIAFWKRPAFGMTIRTSETHVPSLVISVGKKGEMERSFDVSAGSVVPGVYFAFPDEWDVKTGESVSVSVAEKDATGVLPVRYLTSRTVS